MKKAIKYAILGATALFMSGCGGAMNSVKVTKKKDNFYSYSTVYAFHNSNNNIFYNIKVELLMAAQEGKKNGFKYFAVINKNVNNLQGFPINKPKDLHEFCQAYRIYKKADFYKLRCPDIGGVEGVKVVYFKEPIPGLALYNIERILKSDFVQETLNEVKKCDQSKGRKYIKPFPVYED